MLHDFGVEAWLDRLMGESAGRTPGNCIGEYWILSSRSSKTYLVRIYF